MRYLASFSIALALVASAEADILAGHPDPAPTGHDQWRSPIVTPSPLTAGTGDWAEAVAKAKAFVGDLTLDEKVNLTTGIGLLGSCLGNTGSIPRKGFGGFCLQDGPAGVRRASNNSVFPAAVNIAATWDKAMMHEQGRALGAEFRAKGVHIALTPGQNLQRTPAAGRNFEMPGADPYLTGVTVANQIAGIQSQGVIAVAKHLIANEQEHARGGSLKQGYSSNIDDRTLHEVYLWPFAESVHAGVASMMTSYNRLNQTFAAHNSYIVNGLVKGLMDFQGFIMTDWSSQTAGIDSALAGLDMSMPGYKTNGHGNASSPLDPDTGYPGEPDPSKGRAGVWGAHLSDAVRNGTLPEERFTDMAVRIMAAYFKLGQDKDFPEVNLKRPLLAQYSDERVSSNHAERHAKLIRDMGAASTVLLKNSDGALPLRLDKPRNIGIFGADAGRNPDGPNACEDRACFKGTNAMGWGSGTADFPYLVDPYQALAAYVHNEGSGKTTIKAVLEDDKLDEAAKIASSSDICLVFVGSDAGEAYMTVEGNEGDRNDLKLWHGGEDLVKTVAKECSNTIVIIHSPGPADIESFADSKNVTAIIAAGQPGQESGNAITDVLFGKVNPSGRLPYTWGKNRGDYCDDVHYYNVTGLTVSSPIETIPQLDYSEKLLIDYRWFDAKAIEPRYAFGHGLSYTKFSYQSMKITKLKDLKAVSEPFLTFSADAGVQHPFLGHTKADELESSDYLFENALQIDVKIKNDGPLDGHEVVQLYIDFPKAADEPPKVLRGFERVHIRSGKAVTASLKLRVKDLSIWDVPSQKWVVPEGKYRVLVGGASDKIDLAETVVW